MIYAPLMSRSKQNEVRAVNKMAIKDIHVNPISS
jgi:hypothetical protein